jgi:hypothetical protein
MPITIHCVWSHRGFVPSELRPQGPKSIFHKFGPYVADRESSTWVKVLNRGYSQKQSREELFERERHKEPVAGWHACVLACAELGEAS